MKLAIALAIVSLYAAVTIAACGGESTLSEMCIDENFYAEHYEPTTEDMIVTGFSSDTDGSSCFYEFRFLTCSPEALECYNPLLVCGMLESMAETHIENTHEISDIKIKILGDDECAITFTLPVRHDKMWWNSPTTATIISDRVTQTVDNIVDSFGKN